MYGITRSSRVTIVHCTLYADNVSGFHSGSVRLSDLFCIANNWPWTLPGNRKAGTEVGLCVSSHIPIYAWFHVVAPITW